MPQGGNTYEKYEKKRRIDGKLCLELTAHDTCCRLIAEGEEIADITSLLNDELTAEQIEEGLRSWQWQRRIAFLKKQIEKDNFEPSTPDECFAFVKSKLVALSKSADIEVKEKIAALKTLTEVAVEERKYKPAPAKPEEELSPAMQRLIEASGAEQ